MRNAPHPDPDRKPAPALNITAPHIPAPDWDRIAALPVPDNCGWSGNYRVRYSEIGDNGHVLLPALADYMQDAAGWGAGMLQLAYDDTAPKGVAWVLARMVIHMRDYPRNGDTITLQTWPSGISRRVVTRDFRLLDGNGRVIGVAQSFWVLFDLSERRAANWPEWLMQRLPDPPGPRLIEPPLRPDFDAGNLTDCDILCAHAHDLDLYGHVNNVRLMQWVLGTGQTASPPGTFQPAGIDMQFRAECRAGEQIIRRRDGRYITLHRATDGMDLVRATILPGL